MSAFFPSVCTRPLGPVRSRPTLNERGRRISSLLCAILKTMPLSLTGEKWFAAFIWSLAETSKVGIECLKGKLNLSDTFYPFTTHYDVSGGPPLTVSNPHNSPGVSQSYRIPPGGTLVSL